MPAYYNEIDPFAAAWLRNLIAAGHIAPGDVDERDIRDVRPDDLRNYAQCHFFAGIGVWSYGLRRAGWPDDRPVWTGSCPCQPFSQAGQGDGFADERHLWPAFHHLIAQSRPDVVFGEQVASKDGLAWLDLVQADMEATDYAFGTVDLCAAGVGAPHIRQRLYWCADSESERQGQVGPDDRGSVGGSGAQGRAAGLALRGRTDLLGGVDHEGSQGRRRVPERACQRAARSSGVAGELADADGGDASAEGLQRSGQHGLVAQDGSARQLADTECVKRGSRGLCGPGSSGTRIRERPTEEFAGSGLSYNPGSTNGVWRDADWLYCRDGKWRPVRPGAQQMADGSTASLGRLRPADIERVEEAVEAWAKRHQRDGTEAVRNLWDILSQGEAGQRADGGFDSLHEAPFLLAFLRQLSDQGWRFPIGDERSSSEASRTVLRVLRYDDEPCYSSRGRGLDEQQSAESSDALRFLSQILAHHTTLCWGNTGWKNAGSFPLTRGAKSRVGRLRAYGNAVVAPQVEEFVKAYIEASLLLGVME